MDEMKEFVQEFLFKACKNDWEAIFYLLDKKGADFTGRDEKGRTVAHLSASSPERLRVLEEFGVDFSARDNKGNTPAHYAAKSGSLESLEFLAGIDVDPIDLWALNNEGKSPLDLALAEGREIFTLLLPKEIRGLKIDDTDFSSILDEEKGEYQLKGEKILDVVDFLQELKASK